MRLIGPMSAMRLPGVFQPYPCPALTRAAFFDEVLLQTPNWLIHQMNSLANQAMHNIRDLKYSLL